MYLYANTVLIRSNNTLDSMVGLGGYWKESKSKREKGQKREREEGQKGGITGGRK